MRSCMFFSLRLTRRSDGLHSLFFSCQRNPSWGRSARQILLPFVYCQYWHICISANYYLFLQGVPQHLGCFPSLASQPSPIWTITRGIRSDLEGPFLFGCLRRFRRSLRNGQRIFLIASTRACVSITSDIFKGLRSGCQVFE